jgi:excisionase family DNA binding protein
MSTDFPSVAFVANASTEFHPEPPTVREQIAEAVAVDAGAQVDSVEAAAILGVTANNLRQMVHKGQISPVGKRGRRTIFNRADVEDLAARRRK